MFQADESGCEADMAEGGQEDDSGDVTTMSPHKLDAGDAPLNLKSEVSRFKIPAKKIFFLSLNAFFFFFRLLLLLLSSSSFFYSSRIAIVVILCKSLQKRKTFTCSIFSNDFI